jgi:hypothetical protein
LAQKDRDYTTAAQTAEKEMRDYDMKSRMNRMHFCVATAIFMSVVASAAVAQGIFDSYEYLGKVAPRHAKEIESSPWGIQASTLDRDLLELAARIGVKWTRLGASWPSIERKRGVYDWSGTDEAFAASLAKGITPFVTLGSGNRLYTKMSTYDDPKLAEIYGSRPGPPTESPEALEAWLAFVEAAVERYKDRIIYWEIWNEPNHRNYWGAEPDPHDYGRLVNKTASLIKRVQPDAVILAGSMAGLDETFTAGFLAEDKDHLVDVVTYHNYGAIPEQRIYRAVKVWDAIEAHNPKIEMWQGECGYPSHSSTRDYRGSSPWGLNIQSKWLLRQAFTDVYFCRATMSNYFKLVHTGKRGERAKRSFLSDIDKVLGFPERDGSRVRTVGVNEKCLLTNPELEPKPAYFAYQNLCSVMDARYKRVELKHEVKVLDQGQFYGVGDEDDAFPSVPLVATFKTSDNECLVAYWLPWHPQEHVIDPATVSLSVKGAKFEAPVLVDLLNGKVYRLEKRSSLFKGTVFRTLPLSDVPYLVVEERAVKLAK